MVWHPASSPQDSAAALRCSFPSSRQRLRRRDIRPHLSRPGSFRAFVIAVVAQFLRHPPREAASAAVKPADSTSQLGKRQFTTAEMMRTPQFYTMYVAFVLMSIGGLLVTAQAGPIARTWGYSTGVLTLAASLSPLANGGSRIFWGWASDKIGRETAMIIAFILQAICLLLVVGVGADIGRLVRVHARARLLHVGRDLFIVPRDRGRLFRNPPRDLELRHALHGQGRRSRSSVAISARCCTNSSARGLWASTGARRWLSSRRRWPSGSVRRPRRGMRRSERRVPAK